MKLCPIAHWKKHQCDALAFSSMTYGQFDELVCRYCYLIEKIPGEILAFLPQNTIANIAFCFAAWRSKKVLFPLNKRLPINSISERIALTKATLVNPEEWHLSKTLNIETIDETSMAILIETSSSSKIVRHTLFALMTSGDAAVKALELCQGDTYCINLPLFHISGIALMLRTFLVGATLLFPDEMEKATHISMVPTQLFRHLKTELAFSSLKCLLIGGAPLGQTLKDEALEKGLPLYTTYGMTETASIAVLKKGNEKAKVLSHLELVLAEDGEILMRGPSLMIGYFERDPLKGWFHTKDLGHISESGELTILGRKDRQFISGGENIQPEEIEGALLKLPFIVQAKVFPMRDPEYGMIPKAEVYCSRVCTEGEIRSDLRSFLPKYKIPVEILIESDLSKFSKIP